MIQELQRLSYHVSKEGLFSKATLASLLEMCLESSDKGKLNTDFHSSSVFGFHQLIKQGLLLIKAILCSPGGPWLSVWLFLVSGECSVGFLVLFLLKMSSFHLLEVPQTN